MCVLICTVCIRAPLQRPKDFEYIEHCCELNQMQVLFSISDVKCKLFKNALLSSNEYGRFRG